MNLKLILWFSFFLNAFSFLFTVRPRRAIILIGIFLIIGFIGNYLLKIEFFPQPVEFCLVILFLFLPVCLNAVFITIHESNLMLANGTRAGKLFELLSHLEDLVS